jgi:hypothetical protein
MSSTAESSRVDELSVKAGEHYFLRQDARMGVSAGCITLVKKDEATGMKKIDGYQLIVSAYKQE